MARDPSHRLIRVVIVKSRLLTILVTIFAALAMSLATSFVTEWAYQLVPHDRQDILEVTGLGALLLIPVVGFWHLMRKLQPKWIAGVLFALAYFPLMLLTEFWLLILTGLSDYP